MTLTASISKPEPTKLYRWIVLIFVSMITFGSYFAYDALGPIIPKLKSYLAEEQILIIVGMYSLPNIIMLLFTGTLLDFLGTRKGGIIFAVICMFGAIITAMTAPDFTGMYIGRIVFGLGSESLIVSQSTIIAKWFKGKELALAMGINLTFCRLGSLLSINGMGWIADNYSFNVCLWIAAILCFVSVLAFILYWLLEVKGERKYSLIPEEEQEKIKLSDMRFLLKPSYIFICLLCVLFYSPVFTFQNIAPDFILEKFKFSLPVATMFSGLIVFTTMGCTPLLGLLVDKVGRRALLMVFGSILLVTSYLLINFSNLHPIIPITGMGMAFSLVPAAMWPSVAKIVKRQVLGSAYGIMTLIQNIGLTAIPWVSSQLVGEAGQSASYSDILLFFAGIAGLGIICAIAMLISEYSKHSGGLEKPQLEEEPIDVKIGINKIKEMYNHKYKLALLFSATSFVCLIGFVIYWYYEFTFVYTIDFIKTLVDDASKAVLYFPLYFGIFILFVFLSFMIAAVTYFKRCKALKRAMNNI